MKKEKSMFGSHFKLVLVLTILAWMTYTLPTVKAELGDAAQMDPASQTGAVVNSVSSSAVTAAVSMANTPAAGKPFKCPIGWICIPAPLQNTDVVAKVDGQPKLELVYDSAHKESMLTATFKVTIDGGKKGINIYGDLPCITLYDGFGQTVSANYCVGNSALVAVSKVTTVKDSNGTMMYVIPAGKKVQFQTVNTINPKALFAGTYSASLQMVYANTGTDPSTAFKIMLQSNATNSKTIVGETGPYITSVSPNPATPGQNLTINGARLAGGLIFIDNAPLSGSMTGPIDGTSLTIVVPPLSDGWHSIYVKNDVSGMSNYASFEVRTNSSIVVSQISPTRGVVGSTVVIYGTGFAAGSVFHWVGPATDISMIPTSISADGTSMRGTVPSGPLADFNVSVSNGASESNWVYYTIASSTPACPYIFNTNLQVGSTGPDVVALQSTLIANSFAISTGITGTYDATTASAVSSFQTAHGLVETGFVGPITRAVLNSLSCPITPVCPPGFVCTGITTTAITPANSNTSQ